MGEKTRIKVKTLIILFLTRRKINLFIEKVESDDNLEADVIILHWVVNIVKIFNILQPVFLKPVFLLKDFLPKKLSMCLYCYPLRMVASGKKTTLKMSLELEEQWVIVWLLRKQNEFSKTSRR